MFSEEPITGNQLSPKDATLGVIPLVMEKNASEPKDPTPSAWFPNFPLSDLRDHPEKSDMFSKATLNFLRRKVFPVDEDKYCSLPSILDDYLSIWSEICDDKGDILRTQIDSLYMLDSNLMTAVVAMQEKRDELWLKSEGYERYEDDEESPDAREVYCPNCDESSEEDKSEDLCRCPIHPNTGTAYLACGITTNPWKRGPAGEDKGSAATAAACRAREMAASKIPADENDCACPCATCSTSRGVDSGDDSYFSPSSESESEDEMPCQC